MSSVMEQIAAAEGVSVRTIQRRRREGKLSLVVPTYEQPVWPEAEVRRELERVFGAKKGQAHSMLAHALVASGPLAAIECMTPFCAHESRRLDPAASGDIVNSRCYSAKAASFDHIVPVSRNGTDDPENIQLAHRSCNTSRNGY